MDDDWASNTIAILGEVVRVIPRRTVLSRLPLVQTGLTWGKSALGNTRDTVVRVGAQLTDSVPMNSSAVLGHAVGDINLDLVAPVALDGRTWDSGLTAIIRYGETEAVGAIKIASRVRDGQVVLAGLASIGPCSGGVRVDVKATAPRLPIARAVAGRAGVTSCGIGCVATRCVGWGCGGGCAADGRCGDYIGNGGNRGGD